MSPESFPSASPPPETEHPFLTQSTTFAAALVAGNLLAYLRAERKANSNDVVFFFEDPLAQGDELHRRFDAGMFPRVDPKLLFGARAFLVEEMNRLQGRGRHASKKAL